MGTSSKARLQMIAAAMLWSLGGVLIKLVDWNALAIAGMRSLIAAVVIFAYLKKPHFTWSKAQIGGAVDPDRRIACGTQGRQQNPDQQSDD